MASLPLLFDPLDPPPGAWPRARTIERDYLVAVARIGLRGVAANLDAEWRALTFGERAFPLTVNHGERGGSYVTVPHSAYALYARDELGLIAQGWRRRLLEAVVDGGAALFAPAQVNRIVQLDNWLFATSLHGDWDGEGIEAIRDRLATAYPAHIIGIRSLDRWSSPALFDAVVRAGAVMLPGRPIWVTDDPAAALAGRKNVANDRRALRKSGLVVERLERVGDADAGRIARLYTLLYVDKYSRLNPQFTPAFVTASAASGALAFHVARDAEGVIQAVAGIAHRGEIVTSPLLGYDTARPPSDALYRIAALMSADAAIAAGARLHGSSGAGDFKRQRGAVSAVEYNGWFVDHLPPVRRAAIRALAAMLMRVAVPAWHRHGL